MTAATASMATIPQATVPITAACMYNSPGLYHQMDEEAPARKASPMMTRIGGA